MPNDRDPRRETAGQSPHARAAAEGQPRARSTSLALLGIPLGILVALVVGWVAFGNPARAPGLSAAGSALPVAALGSPSSTAVPIATSPAAASPSPSDAPLASAPVSPTPGPSASATAPPPPIASQAPGAAGGAQAALQAKLLQRRLDALRARRGIPGVSVAIVWNDGRQWLGASGRADAAGRVPMTTGTAFALASISKTFTAAVVLQLVEEGKLALDQRVAPLLPAYRLDRRITVRMLLDHTSGLPDFFFGAGIDAALQRAPDAAWTAQRAWRYVRKHRPTPGKVWSYSNTNYLLLGEVVEAVTGRPLAREIRTRLLDPLDLNDAWYQGVEKPRAPETAGFRLFAAGGAVKAAPVAPRSDVMPFRSVVTAAGGAGSMAATALDTALWMQAFAGGRVLTPAMQAQMIGDMANTRRLESRLPYGLGIQAVPIAGYPALGHSGRYLGFRNVVRYLPAQGVTIAVLTNQGGYDPARIAAALLKVILPPG